MHIFHSIQEIPADFGPSVVTIGNFDGVHRGHQAVLQEMIARARALHARSIAVTFDPHPVRVLRPQIPLRLITQQEQKLAWLANSGIDAVAGSSVHARALSTHCTRVCSQHSARFAACDRSPRGR